MKTTEKANKTVVTGTIGDDPHTIGISLLQHALRDAGFNVVALGVQVPPEEFINAAIEANADAILVSSLAGHAKVWVEGFRSKCVEAGLNSVRLYLGGKLLVNEAEWVDVEKMFKKMGFDRVYPPLTLPRTVIADLEADLL